jgi:hypothetical protein
MNITQGYVGNYSHEPHATGTPKDYPWDEACGNTGRSPMYCPCDEMKIKRIYTKETNTLWLESTTKVNLADGTYDYVTLMVTHPNDSDIKRLSKGQKFKRGDLICYEGTDGNATGNHFHFAVGKGKYLGTGWAKNTKGKWVLTCTGGAKKPEEMFYIDKAFTTLVKKTQGIKFKNLPKQTTIDDFLPAIGYFKKGDTHENIGKIAEFMYKNFPLYTKKQALGNYYGKNLVYSIKEFKKRTRLPVNEKIDRDAVEYLINLGFKL